MGILDEIFYAFRRNKSKVAVYSRDQVDKKINDIVIPTKTSELTNDSNFATTNDLPTKTSELTNDSDFATNATVNKKTVYSDFAITQNTVSHPSANNFTIATSHRNKALSAKVTKDGYYPIALLGVRGTDADEKYDYRYGYLSNQAKGSCTVNWIFTNSGGASVNASDLPSCEVTVLWAKIRE